MLKSASSCKVEAEVGMHWPPLASTVIDEDEEPVWLLSAGSVLKSARRMTKSVVRMKNRLSLSGARQVDEDEEPEWLRSAGIALQAGLRRARRSVRVTMGAKPASTPPPAQSTTPSTISPAKPRSRRSSFAVMLAPIIMMLCAAFLLHTTSTPTSTSTPLPAPAPPLPMAPLTRLTHTLRSPKRLGRTLMVTSPLLLLLPFSSPAAPTAATARVVTGVGKPLAVGGMAAMGGMWRVLQLHASRTVPLAPAHVPEASARLLGASVSGLGSHLMKLHRRAMSVEVALLRTLQGATPF